MTRSRYRSKARGNARFLGLPHEWLHSEQWTRLDPFEIKLLIDLAAQYNGRNNGDFTAAWSVMKRRGWRSPGTLNKALKGLLVKGWIDRTRQGGRHVASLFAMTFWGIDECGGKLDTGPNPVPSHRWKNALPSRDAYQSSRVAYQSQQEPMRKAA